jgi:hypothetical protein
MTGERGDRGEAARAERARRVADVMRENLRKRKEQERARETGRNGPAGREQVPDGAPGPVDR